MIILTGTALPRDYTPISMLQYVMFSRFCRRKWSTSGFHSFLLGKFEFEFSEFFIIWRLISSVQVFLMLIISKYVNYLSISLDKSSEISWNILSTKLKIFCWEELETTCNFTTLNTIAQTGIADNKDNTSLIHHVEIEIKWMEFKIWKVKYCFHANPRVSKITARLYANRIYGPIQF